MKQKAVVKAQDAVGLHGRLGKIDDGADPISDGCLQKGLVREGVVLVQDRKMNKWRDLGSRKFRRSSFLILASGLEH
ncbi:MAG: hypothetical protein EXS36_20405 [Pedosphaera sp.]|nr:hypothetical protein [Pedosphaera sp.]